MKNVDYSDRFLLYANDVETLSTKEFILQDQLPNHLHTDVTFRTVLIPRDEFTRSICLSSKLDFDMIADWILAEAERRGGDVASEVKNIIKSDLGGIFLDVNVFWRDLIQHFSTYGHNTLRVGSTTAPFSLVLAYFDAWTKKPTGAGLANLSPDLQLIVVMLAYDVLYKMDITMQDFSFVKLYKKRARNFRKSDLEAEMLRTRLIDALKENLDRPLDGLGNDKFVGVGAIATVFANRWTNVIDHLRNVGYHRAHLRDVLYRTRCMLTKFHNSGIDTAYQSMIENSSSMNELCQCYDIIKLVLNDSTLSSADLAPSATWEQHNVEILDGIKHLSGWSLTHVNDANDRIGCQVFFDENKFRRGVRLFSQKPPIATPEQYYQFPGSTSYMGNKILNYGYFKKATELNDMVDLMKTILLHAREGSLTKETVKEIASSMWMKYNYDGKVALMQSSHITDVDALLYASSLAKCRLFFEITHHDVKLNPDIYFIVSDLSSLNEQQFQLMTTRGMYASKDPWNILLLFSKEKDAGRPFYNERPYPITEDIRYLEPLGSPVITNQDIEVDVKIGRQIHLKFKSNYENIMNYHVSDNIILLYQEAWQRVSLIPIQVKAILLNLIDGIGGTCFIDGNSMDRLKFEVRQISCDRQFDHLNKWIKSPLGKKVLSKIEHEVLQNDVVTSFFYTRSKAQASKTYRAAVVLASLYWMTAFLDKTGFMDLSLKHLLDDYKDLYGMAGELSLEEKLSSMY